MPDHALNLVNCFATVFPDLTEPEIRAASVSTLESWDSIASVTLLAVIEEEMGVQIPFEDLERFISLSSIQDYLGHQQAAA